VSLLFDENLSPRLVGELAELFPQSLHVDQVSLHGQSDQAIWEYATQNSLVIVSKDDDFRQRSFLHGAPPKVIWLSVGNAGTIAIVSLLARSQKIIETFIANPEESLLILSASVSDDL
jgi:predicted nuclease of predicted toxin-antitoxin system